MLFVIFIILSIANLSFLHADKCVGQPCNIIGDRVNFITIGDWGGTGISPYTTEIQRKVAESLNQVAIKENVHFYIDTGDRFYPNGVKNVEDPRFQVTFEGVYNKSGHQKLWHMVAGNHDYYGNVTAQTAYTQRSWRWNFPKLFYTVSYHLNSLPMADFVMIDTIVLCGYNNLIKDSQPPGPANPQLAEEEWQWIDKSLAASKATYLFLVGHYPVRSTGVHGPKCPCLYERMEAMMEKYRVSAYLTGHDHNLEYYRFWSKSGAVLNYITSGYAAKLDLIRMDSDNVKGESVFYYPEMKVNEKDVAEEQKVGGFVLTTLTNFSAHFHFYNGASQPLYTFSVEPRKI